MRRNSSFIGSKSTVNTSVAGGVHETFDHYINKVAGAWPIVGQSARLELNGSTFNEGQTVLCTVYTTGINAGTPLNWKLNFVSGNALTPTDFSAISGTIVVTTSYAEVISISISADALTEGTESFTVTVLDGLVPLGTSSPFTVNDTSTGTAEPTALYTFLPFTFTNANITGRFGPTLQNCLAAYDTATHSWLTNTAYFNVITGGYQLWTVPSSGNFQITVIGAAGGIGFGASGTRGYGARMVSTLALTQGSKLIIIVGHQGTGTGTNSCGGEGGGGGGSFVFTEGGTCLMAAGGGGGGSQNSFNRDVTFRDAPNSTSGNKGSGTTGGLGGTGGNGGGVQVGSCVSGGGAGAGILTAGAVNGQPNAAATYSQGFTGGQGGNAGGFGGGGGAGTSYAAGGGGGYSGGGGGGLQTCSCNDMGNGGGGGCFSTTSYTYTAQIGTGHGSVSITAV